MMEEEKMVHREEQLKHCKKAIPMLKAQGYEFRRIEEKYETAGRSEIRFKKYIVLFILLVLVVIFIVLKGADIESVWKAMKNADPKWLTAGLGLAAVFNIAEGINLRKVLVSFGYRVSFKEAMKYAYIGYFFSSVTPSATGGQPLQLYAMSKDKIHVAHGTMALLTELTSFQIAAFLTENIAAFWILTGRIHLNKIMLILALVGYIMNLVLLPH